MTRSTSPAVDGSAPIVRELVRRRPMVVLGLVTAGCVLFLLYLHQSTTQAVDADGASNVLQAWDMVHGNLLLRGWTVSDVSFYTTELPQYMLLVWIRGLSPDVVHLGGAMTYVLLLVMAALLAKGDATGRPAVIRALTPVGIMLAPQLGVGTYVLLLNPAHLGSAVPVLLAWLVLDRCGTRWYVPVAAGALLTWGEIADPLVTVVGAAPLLVVAAIRFLQRREQRRFAAALAAAAVCSVAASTLALRIIRGLGGFIANTPSTDFASRADIRADLPSSFQDVLLLFGADFYRTPPQADYFGQQDNPHSSLDLFFAVVHLLGLALVLLAVVAAVRRFLPRGELIEQLLAAGIVIDLVAFMLRLRPDQNLTNTREIVVVLPMGAVLAGRFLARLVSRRRRANRIYVALGAVLLIYAGGLLHNLRGTPVPAQGEAVAGWLEQHNLRYGVAAHWAANSITVASGNRVRVRSVSPAADGLVPRAWESAASWYDPRSHDATFVVIDDLNRSYGAYLTGQQAESAYGKPMWTHRIGAYTILVWDKNLLAS